MTKRAIVVGADGKMGTYTTAAITQTDDLELVACCNSQDNLAQLLQQHHPDVAVDFTLPHCVFDNVITMIEHNVHPVVGTSGLSQEQLSTITNACTAKKLGGIFAPNFSIGAVLMMEYATAAAQYFDYAEIIERHHEKKVDAPSGTATHTQQQLQQYIDTVPVHSVRMPGLFAHQEVNFGAIGETLTIRHDAIDRTCMMPGVVLACRKVAKLNGFVVGLQHLLTLQHH